MAGRSGTPPAQDDSTSMAHVHSLISGIGMNETELLSRATDEIGQQQPMLQQDRRIL